MAAVYHRGTNGKPRLTVSSSGEYDVLACPFCHDTRGKLYVNHRWGVTDAMTRTRNLWLATCFLSGCMRTWENQKELFELVEEYAVAAGAGAVRVPAVAETAPELTRYSLPDDFVPLTDSSPRHVARRYVRDRGFDAKELVRNWGVGYSTEVYRGTPGRLVIPIRAYFGEDGSSALGDPEGWDCVGYLGRVLGEASKNTPKYLTTQRTPKSRILYGLERVSPGTGPLVLVEGPTDVWRAGPGAVAVLGKDVSDAQCKLLRTTCPGRDVVVMLDPEAGAEADHAADKVRAVLTRDLTTSGGPGRVVVARLPDTRDPGECTRDEIWAAVRTPLSGGRRARRKSAKR